jgi:hypothetical protein
MLMRASKKFWERVVLYVDDMCTHLRSPEMDTNVAPNLIWSPSTRQLQPIPFG